MGGPVRSQPGVDPRRGKLMCVKVRLLDDTIAVFHLGHKATGQMLLDEVSRHLNLLESDYFGLEFVDNEGCHVWLDMEKQILRQIAGTDDVKFHLIVKFYTPNPMDLEEEYTRYLLSLQIRRDLSQGHFLSAESTAALLAAYFVQSDCGDFSAEDYPDASYLSHTRFVPNQTIHFQQKVMECHKKLIGLTPEDADMQMLEVARRCDFYGIKLHPARDIEGTEACLAVMHLGIKVFHQFHCVSTFSWAKIRKLSFKRKKLLIKLHPDSYQCYKETIEFYFDSRNECKNFWKKCVEHHGFFRCIQVEMPKKDNRLFSKGSSFRYHGRTQKQLIDYVREHHKRREPFTRPLRSGYHTCGLGSSATSAISSTNRNARDRSHTSAPTVATVRPQHQATAADPGLHDSTLDATTSLHRHSHRHQKRSYENAYDRGAVSDVEGPSTVPPAPRDSSVPPRISTSCEKAENMSLSLPNVLDEPDTSSNAPNLVSEPPKSRSGDNFRRDSRDFDNVSQDSYNLSDHDKLREDALATTFTAKRVGDVVVKRVHTSTRSQVSTTDDESSIATRSESAVRRHIKEFPFHQHGNLVPVEIDGPNVDAAAAATAAAIASTATPLSATFTQHTPIYTSTGAILMKPKVIAAQQHSPSPPYQYTSIQRVTCRPASPDYANYSAEKRSTSPQTYGAIGPLPGKVITKESIVITPEGIKERSVLAASKPKPAVPPKPKLRPVSGEYDEVATEDAYAKVDRRLNHPVVNLAEALSSEETQPKPAPPPVEAKPEPPPHSEQTLERKLSKPALISVQSEDQPDIEKCQFFDESSIPYTLTVRKIDSPAATSAPNTAMSTFKQEFSSNSLTRISSKSPESFLRRKSLDLVPRKKLPSPTAYSSMDHTISPTTPESGDVLEYLLRRRSMSQERSSLAKKGRRGDPRRQTQPVRFTLPPESPKPSGAESTPALHRQSSLDESNAKTNEDDDYEMPPPPPIQPKKAKTPPPPPPKPKEAAEKVAQMKKGVAESSKPCALPPLVPSMDSVQEESSEVSGSTTVIVEVTETVVTHCSNTSDSPPFIDESPKNEREPSPSSGPTSRRTETGLLWTDF